MIESPSGAVWRKVAGPSWLQEHAAALARATDGSYATIERPGHARLTIECFCARLAEATTLQRRLGGTIERVAAGWLERSAETHLHKPIRIGRRLVIVADRAQVKMDATPNALVIPAAAAFGTGDHATTAMSLRLLEQFSRGMSPGWDALDLGTGSGILALAARRFGASEAIGIDNDARAVRTAQENARINRIKGVRFRLGDALKVIGPRRFDLITANLFSELLIRAAPVLQQQLRAGGVLIVSGILRTQEQDVAKALRRHGFRVLKVRRRGKWIAMLCTTRTTRSRQKAG
ncbi:MAG: 50S ribosomal protein L11 methyltransferase [Verrucomicrobiota bacterium]|nr:50S ribosomal protein L11 methyltransferase [Verrucomicrobiota bacterium]